MLPAQRSETFVPHVLGIVAVVVLTPVLWTVTYADPQIYWKKDYIRDGNGNLIAEATPQPSDTTAPSAPTMGGHSNVTSTSAQITWSGPGDSNCGSDLGGFKVYRGPVVVGVTGCGATSFTDTTLKPATSYVYKVTCFDVSGNHSSASATTSFTTSN